MIIEAINDNELKGRKYKKGDQKNVVDGYGEFLVKHNQNWRYVKGAQNTKLEAEFYAALKAEDDKTD